MLNLQEIAKMIKTETTQFVSLKPGINPGCYLDLGLIPGVLYVSSRIGWNMKNNSSQILYINELGTWVPAIYLDVNKGIIPN